MIRREKLLPNLEQVKRMQEAHKGESDRGIVLVYATILDETLKRCIESHLVNQKDVRKFVNDPYAPLGTFSARITCAFAIGLIPEAEFRELNLIRKIRNRFAHSVDVSFQSSSIVSYCNQLLSDSPPLAAMCPSPRDRFVMSAEFMGLQFESRLPEISDQRLFYQEWNVE
jgi:DNA-binding MltR family transcriptional regulator